MTKKISLIPLLTLALIFTSCGMGSGNNSATHDEGVVINGIRWATHNVGRTPGTFVENHEDIGGHFVFNGALNACPQGWRLPTQRELQSLVDAGSEWTTKNGVNGRLFGSGSNQVFLPAAGLRAPPGMFSVVGEMGYYWSSLASGVFGSYLGFSSIDIGVDLVSPGIGFSVRCVAKRKSWFRR